MHFDATKTGLLGHPGSVNIRRISPNRFWKQSVIYGKGRYQLNNKVSLVYLKNYYIININMIFIYSLRLNTENSEVYRQLRKPAWLFVFPADCFFALSNLNTKRKMLIPQIHPYFPLTHVTPHRYFNSVTFTLNDDRIMSFCKTYAFNFQTGNFLNW